MIIKNRATLLQEMIEAWHKANNVKGSSIELPEAPQEWMPDVGESCLGLIPVNNIKRDFLEVSVLYYFEDEDVFAVKCKQDSRLYYCKVFKPLKTQEQKDRETFIDDCLKATAGNEPHKIFHDLYEAGARFTNTNQGDK